MTTLFDENPFPYMVTRAPPFVPILAGDSLVKLAVDVKDTDETTLPIPKTREDSR